MGIKQKIKTAPSLKKTTSHSLPTLEQHIELGRQMIEALILGRDAQTIKEIGNLRLIPKGEIGEIPGFSIGSIPGDRRIGGKAPDQKKPPYETGVPGFKDPLEGHGNQHPRSTVVGPGTIPGKGSLTSQDGDRDTRYGSGSGSSHGYVWVDRSTSRQSTDGTHTWGGISYRDYSGNHWRVDYVDSRHADGSVTSKDTVFDSHGDPIKTTLREGAADGTATETTTTHETGETQTNTGTFEEIFPERSVDPDAPSRGGDPVAPRGWYNPITGVAYNPGVKTNNNQVNPGRDPGAATSTKSGSVILNPKDLLVNPPPDVIQSKGRPRDIRAGNPTIVDPPRPTKK